MEQDSDYEFDDDNEPIDHPIQFTLQFVRDGILDNMPEVLQMFAQFGIRHNIPEFSQQPMSYDPDSLITIPIDALDPNSN